METFQKLLPEFEGVDKATWLFKITNDLKGKTPEDLTWSVQGLEIFPFMHAQDFPEKFSPIPGSDPAWQIGTSVFINVTDVKTANRKCLFLLNAGATALRCIFDFLPSSEQLNVLFSEVLLEFISVHFYIPAAESALSAFLHHFQALIQDKQFDALKIKGSVCVTAPSIAEPHPVNARLLEWASRNLPLFNICVVDENHLPSSQENIPEGLFRLVNQASLYIASSVSQGIAPAAAAAQIQFSINIGLLFFIEIARIRALHLLWANLLDSYGLPPSPASIHAFTDASTKAGDPNCRLIRSTTQAMAAAIGGVESITLNIFPQPENGGALTQCRLSVNIQHLLQMEAYMDKVADPAAGSYYLETLTRQMGQKAWTLFQES